ncbi:bZIP transcription factor (AP-1), putative [Cordyceps militaris CM01]|uniref:BZIP transcription factor (AP-1), putative n=1 Tax=Cordyceps militaris (strain CM01) TaxID=983644 RepID=G3JUL9_CORMM|nr:bZIP transcription factor (AP-1), putative [Cordyceps militaris CM01]EGX87755.1 bZIP transcription factor (AP-1), putative [Cordyceps militaris CM01]
MSANTNEHSGDGFFLTPHQQGLLFAALNTNKQQALTSSAAPNPVSLSPSSFKHSPSNGAPVAGGYQESPFIDNYEYEFGDSSFDFSFAGNDQAAMIGDMPSTSDKSDTPEDDLHEKRSYPDDDDDDGLENDAKRREAGEKIPKKPGRKPLTSEPTSKRKAQNRAAQRAFRERKEKHLKDLEIKVEELEKASEATNHENSRLRAQVDRMNTELKQYKQKMSMLAQPKPSLQSVPFPGAGVNGINDVNFQFEFPKFGALPGPPLSKPAQRSVSQPLSPQNGTQVSSPAVSMSSDIKSPRQSAAQFKEDLAKFSNIFSPSMSSSAGNGSRASVDSANYSFPGATSSPSASSNSNVGPSSSCGTSPEPFTQSPMGFKPVDALSTIGEEQLPINNSEQAFTDFANADFGTNSLDWLAQQNGGQFDPQLFNDYREPQQNIMSNPSFDDFFNDSFDADFLTPFNAATNANLPKKNNLIAEIDAKQNEDDVPVGGKNRRAHEIWEKLQECPKAQSGDFDLDGLCSELTKKAKCSGSGPVVGEVDFDTILKKYMGKDVASECVADKLGIEVDRSKTTKK